MVAGMSGSPVYIDGKLAGALSLKLGQFSKEPLAGVTPIENILSLPKGQPGTKRAENPPVVGDSVEQTQARLGHSIGLGRARRSFRWKFSDAD